MTFLKKLLAAVLCALAVLSGCASQGTGTSSESSDLKIEEPAVPQTNESLTISFYGQDMGAEQDLLRSASKAFQALYPDVELVVEREPYSQSDAGEGYYTRLAAEVMAGRGPDLFWLDSYTMDVYKMMRAGVFANLNIFFENDPDYHPEAYCQPVMAGGRFRGAQYMVPLSYTIPVMVSEKSLLKEQDFPLTKCKDYLSLWQEIERYAQKYQEDPSLPDPVHVYFMNADYSMQSGIDWVNMETGEIKLDSPELEEAIRLDNVIGDLFTTDEESALFTQSWGAANRLFNHSELFEMYSGANSFNRTIMDAMAVASYGEPVLLPVYDVNGGIQAEIIDAVAVRRNSPNQENAYRFIRQLMDPDNQPYLNSICLWEVPIAYEGLERSLDQCEAGLREDRIYALGNMGSIKTLAGLPEDFRKQYREAVSQITRGSWDHRNLRVALITGFRDYFREERTFEECLPDAETEVDLYLSE